MNKYQRGYNQIKASKRSLPVFELVILSAIILSIVLIAGIGDKALIQG